MYGARGTRVLPQRRVHQEYTQNTAPSTDRYTGGCDGGGRGIRTPEPLSRLTVFKTAGFNRSPIPPALTSSGHASDYEVITVVIGFASLAAKFLRDASLTLQLLITKLGRLPSASRAWSGPERREARRQ